MFLKGTLMNVRTITCVLALFVAGACTVAAADDKSMVVIPGGSITPTKVSPQYFTGSAQLAQLHPEQSPSTISAGQVSFEPGAHSNWHTHPRGQLLIITAGSGWVQEWNGKKHDIKAGDVVWTPAGVKHWHGATSSTAMTHIAIQESVEGKNVEWLEAVSIVEYLSN
jgi:quercetin dioxygenase-like cupin family protein